jgi:hypothetical protein
LFLQKLVEAEVAGLDSLLLIKAITLEKGGEDKSCLLFLPPIFSLLMHRYWMLAVNLILVAGVSQPSDL